MPPIQFSEAVYYYKEAEELLKGFSEAMKGGCWIQLPGAMVELTVESTWNQPQSSSPSGKCSPPPAVGSGAPVTFSTRMADAVQSGWPSDSYEAQRSTRAGAPKDSRAYARLLLALHNAMPEEYQRLQVEHVPVEDVENAIISYNDTCFSITGDEVDRVAAWFQRALELTF